MQHHAEVYFNILLPKEHKAACHWLNVAQKDNINLPAWNKQKKTSTRTIH